MNFDEFLKEKEKTMLPKHYGRKVFLAFLYLFYQIQKAAGK